MTLSIIVLVLLFLGAFLPRFSLALAVLPAVMLVSAYAGVGEEELFGSTSACSASRSRSSCSCCSASNRPP